VKEKEINLHKKDDFPKELKNTTHIPDSTAPSEPLHPLEVKYGKEPKIDLEDLWRWH
jgi:hypothetical protein